MKLVDKKLAKLSEWHTKQGIELENLIDTIPDYENYNDMLDEIQRLCVQTQELISKLYM